MGKVYDENTGLIRDYADETIKTKLALIEPGRVEAEARVQSMTAEEVEAILLKLDVLASESQNEAIATMVAEEAEAVLLLARMVKTEAKQPFQGILGSGSAMEIVWVLPVDVGGAILCPSATAGAGTTGLYGGSAASVYTWLHTFTANTADDIIPEQTMKEEAGVIHLGMIDHAAVPKVGRMIIKIAGIPSPAQSLPFSHVDGSELAFARFEKPIIIGPEKTQAMSVMPHITGDSKLELLSLVIGEAEDITFTFV